MVLGLVNRAYDYNLLRYLHIPTDFRAYLNAKCGSFTVLRRFVVVLARNDMGIRFYSPNTLTSGAAAVHNGTTQTPALPLYQPHYQPQPHFDYQYPQPQPYGQAQLGSQIQPQSQFASGSQVNIQPQLQVLSGSQINFQPQINFPPQTQCPPQSSFQLQPQIPFQPQPHPHFQAQLQVPFQPPPQPQLRNQPPFPIQNTSNSAPTAPSQGMNHTSLNQAQNIYSLVQKAYPVSSGSAKLPKANSNPLDGMNWTLGNATRPAVLDTMTSAVGAAGMETGTQFPLPPSNTNNNAAIEAGLPTAMMQLPDLDFFLPGISRADTQDTFSEMFSQGQGPRDGFCDGGDMARGDFYEEIGEGRGGI
ncbi:hypothetical protein BKA63DRAFT_553654 [Paraphoma chrysanthemicola]|nr:hypothetical protein BKA63DRAFT_553654 [Paraphoma chrysanthemicola]